MLNKRIDEISTFRQHFEKEAGGNTRKAHELMGDEFVKLIKEKKLDPKAVSFRAMLDGLVNMPEKSKYGDRDYTVAVAEAITGSGFPVLTNTILNAISMAEYDLYTEDLLSLVTEGTARTTDPEKIAGTTELGDLRRRLEKHGYDEDEFAEKDITIYKADYGKIISLTFETIYNDTTGEVMDRAKTIGEIVGQHIHTTIVETIEGLPRTAMEESLSRSFVYKDTAYTAAQVYSADHSAIDNVVNENTVSGGLTEAGLENGYNAFKGMLNSRGKLITIRPTQLLLDSTKELAARRLFATDQVLPGSSTADKELNVFGPTIGVRFQQIYTPFLSAATTSYLGDFKKALVWLWVEKPNTVTAPSDATLAFEKRIVYRARFNYFGGCGLRDYRFITKIAA